MISVDIDSASETDAKSAMETPISKHNITKLDLVIGNAGISKYFGKAVTTTVRQHLHGRRP